MKSKWRTFYIEYTSWSETVDSPNKWGEIVTSLQKSGLDVSPLEFRMHTNNAPEIPSFGFQPYHTGETLGQWANNNGMKL